MSDYETLQALIKQHSIRIVPPGQEFTLSSGQKSRTYCDLKKTAFRADAHHFFGSFLSKAAESFLPTAFAGVALGGCHLASLAATYTLGKDVIYVRKEAKDHGTKNLIEAPDLQDDARVVLLEDVTTTANSALKALQVLQEGGYDVVAVITVIDRRTDRTDTIGGVPFRALYRLEQFLGPDA